MEKSLMLNRFLCYIYLMTCYGHTSKAPNPALIKNLTSEKKIIDITQQAVTQSLKTEVNSAKLHNDITQETDLNGSIVSKIDSIQGKTAILVSNDQLLPNQSEQLINVHNEKNQTAKQCINTADTNCDQEYNCGLLRYRKWWELNEVELLVNGKLITGMPIFVEEDTLRIINNKHSYFIPLKKIDYIRTNDGLQSSFELKDDKKN